MDRRDAAQSMVDRGGRVRGHGGALPSCSVRALGLSVARRWQWRRTGQTRCCQRGAHRSTGGGGGGEAVR
jgi:hypothetical protein